MLFLKGLLFLKNLHRLCFLRRFFLLIYLIWGRFLVGSGRGFLFHGSLGCLYVLGRNLLGCCFGRGGLLREGRTRFLDVLLRGLCLRF